LYAVIETGGKQYQVSQGDLIKIERLDGEVGEKISFDKILLVSGESSDSLQPNPQGAEVVGTIVDQAKGPKTLVFKFKRRKMYRRLRGHRQLLTSVRIDDIGFGKKPAAKKAKAEPVKKVAAKPTEKKTAAKPKAKAAPKPKATAKPKAKAAAKPKAKAAAKPKTAAKKVAAKPKKDTTKAETGQADSSAESKE
jgi:large subunit ribosomal protein L21